MKTIAFDLMGNDNGIRAGVEAALDFTDKNLDYIVALVGDRKQISIYTKETERIKIIHSPNVVDSTKGARAARSKESSMTTAIQLVKEKKADAVLSSGDSATYLAMATLNFKRMTNVKRPAFMPIFPTIVEGKKFIMMDVGANLEVSAEMLVQWAHLGNVFYQKMFNIKKPRVGIVNIGTEDYKGHDFQIKANKELKKSNLLYKGFIESRDLLKSQVDVAIVDGYAGNMILKTMEGTVLSLLKSLKSALKSKTKYKIGALLARGGFKKAAENLDYRNVGSAWIIGLNYLAIKCHGGADKKSYLGAFNQISQALENDVLIKMKEEMNK